MKGELGIFVHPCSSYRSREQARRIGEKTPDSFLTQEIPDLKNASSILVVGGDGSLRRVFQLLYEKEDLKPIGTLGGGTNNIFHKALIKAGATLSLEEFLEANLKKEKYLFRPGNLGDDYFSVTVGAGQFEKIAGLFLERLRVSTPRRLRLHISSFFSLVSTMARHNPDLLPLDLISASPDFDSITLFPKQELHSSLLTHAWIEEKGSRGVGKLLLTLFCWQTGIEPPQAVLKTEQKETFHLPNEDSRLWVDGDTLLRRNHGNILVSRASQAVAITAIV